jgi:hypothetical protein
MISEPIGADQLIMVERGVDAFGVTAHRATRPDHADVERLTAATLRAGRD